MGAVHIPLRKLGSKMEWIGAGLPWEGSEASQPKLGDLATDDVVCCALDDTIDVVRAALGQGPVYLVVNEERIVLGLVRAEALRSGLARLRRTMVEAGIDPFLANSVMA